MRPRSKQEYLDAGIDNLPSSSSWSRLETECLFDLCEKYDLRFPAIADRYTDYLKARYDREQLARLNLTHLAETAVDPETREPISQEEK